MSEKNHGFDSDAAVTVANSFVIKPPVPNCCGSLSTITLVLKNRQSQQNKIEQELRYVHLPKDLENENDFHLHLDSPEGAVLPFVLRSEGKEEEGALLVTTRLQSCAVRVKANNAWPF